MISTQASAIFLFAHQDDETGIFQKILDEVQCNRKVLCVYLTNDTQNNEVTARRNQESLSVLTKLGVAHDNVIFAGAELNIHDGDLLNHLEPARMWLEVFLARQHSVSSIYLPAWEGGHHDHDALHALGVTIANRAGLENRTQQFSLYNAFNCLAPFFRVLLPLAANGATTSTKVPWSNRFRFLHYCLSYPSQAMSWVGLFPFMFLHYVIWGVQFTQPVSSSRIQQRPHSGPLYYERRNYCTYADLRQRIDATLIKT
jgi:LmbE family N-acetylglucosaminyl deacetylase